MTALEEGLSVTHRPQESLSEIAAKPTFRTIDGVSVRFVESDSRDADALLLSPWLESLFGYDAIWCMKKPTPIGAGS